MKKVYSLLLAVIALFSVNTAKGQEYTVVKSWDFSTLENKEGVTYSDEVVTINKIDCNLGTGEYEGLAWQGANNWFGYDTGGFGLRNHNGGARTMGILGVTTGQRVEIVAGTAGNLNLETPEVATLAGTEDATPSGNEVSRTKYTFDIIADGNLGVKLARYNNIFSVTISEANGGGEPEEPSYATGKLVLADIEGITAGSIADGTVLDGGEFTVTVDGDGEFRTYNSNWYLDITNGTLTFKGVDGKHINKIVLDCTGTWGIVKADVGTLDGTTKTWTGDAETVTFTFSVFQSTFTGFTVGDYVEPATEVANIGALSTIESGENINLALNGAKVTFVKDDIAFIEDETGAIKLSNIGLELTANTALTGNLYATYARGSIPQLSANSQTASSEFTAEQTTVTPTLATVQGLNGMQYTNRLIKLVGSMSVEGNWLSFGGTSVWIDDAFGVLPADYSWPANIGSILAIGGSDGAAQEVYPVSADDIVDAANVQPEVAANVAALKDMPTGIDVELKLEGAVVTVDETVEASTEEPGGDEEPGIDPYAEGERTIIIEDATGAVAINASVAEVLQARKTREEVQPGGLYNTMWHLYDKGIGSLAYQGQWNLFDQIIISSYLLDAPRTELRYWRSEVCNLPFLTHQEGRDKGTPLRTHSRGVWLNGYSDHFPTCIYLVKEVQ